MAAVYYEVPLSPIPQQFGITLAGVPLRLTVAWRNTGGAGWVMDIADAEAVPLVCGIPLVTGTDLLAQYRHLPLPLGHLTVYTDGNLDAVPTFTNLGIDSHMLFWVS